MVENTKFSFHCTVVILSAVIDAMPFLDIGDQRRFTGDIVFHLCVGSAHAVRVVGVAAAEHRQSVLHCEPARVRVGLWGLTGIERLHEIKMFHEFSRVFLVGARARDAQMALSAGMCRSENPAVSVHYLLQNSHRQTAALHQQ